MQFAVYLPVPGIKAIIPGHFKILLRDMLDQEFDEVNSGQCFPDKRIIFVPVVVEGYIVTVIRVNSGKGNDRPAQIAADIFDNGFGIAKIGFGINVKAVFVFVIDFSFGLLKRRADAFFHFVKQDCLERFTEVRVAEIFYSAPETVIRISAFGKKAVDVWIPFKRAAKSVKDADKTRNKIFGFVQGEKKFFNDIGNSLKKAV